MSYDFFHHSIKPPSFTFSPFTRVHDTYGMWCFNSYEVWFEQNRLVPIFLSKLIKIQKLGHSLHGSNRSESERWNHNQESVQIEVEYRKNRWWNKQNSKYIQLCFIQHKMKLNQNQRKFMGHTYKYSRLKHIIYTNIETKWS